MKIYYKKGYKYQLHENTCVQTEIFGHDIKTDFVSLDVNGLLSIYKGYAWDGPSGPTIDSPSGMRGALFHDVGYQLIRENLLPIGFRGYFDELFYRILLEDRMFKLRAWVWYKSVVGFAKGAAMPENDREILEAP